MPLSFRASCRSLVLVALACCTTKQPGHEHPEEARGLIADSAMVVSAHPLATAVGVQVLRDGGSAVDAAIAVHWALAVVELTTKSAPAAMPSAP